MATTTISKDLAALPFEEFKAYIEKIQSSGHLHDVKAEDLYVAAGGVILEVKAKKTKVKEGDK